MTILIIDDQPISRNILSAIIEPIKNGHEVKSFECPRKALTWAVINPVYMVLTDYRMPEMNGIELIKALRGYRAFMHVPVVMISGDDKEWLRQEAIEAGASHFIPKPINLHECRKLCQRLLGR